jgi:hypothetical protein
MEGWRQGRLGSKEDHSTIKGNYKTNLTHTGLLMEGLSECYLTVCGNGYPNDCAPCHSVLPKIRWWCIPAFEPLFGFTSPAA